MQCQHRYSPPLRTDGTTAGPESLGDLLRENVWLGTGGNNSIIYFLPFTLLPCSAILPTTFRGKEQHFSRRLVPQPSSDGLLVEGFLCLKANARRSVYSPQSHLIITLIISDDMIDMTLGTSGLWLPDRSWWHQHTNLKFFLAAAHDSIDSRAWSRNSSGWRSRKRH